MITEERLKKECVILQEKLPPNSFRFIDFNTSNPSLVVGQQTNSRKVYTIKIDLSEFPDSVPVAVITNPKPLKTITGEDMLGASHEMHTLGAINGCTRICHYGWEDWSASVSLYKVIMRIRFWLEMYESHLKTGKPLSNYLNG